MKNTVRNKIKQLAALICALIILAGAFADPAYASGSYSISKSSITLKQGSSTTFTFSASNAVGAFSISTDGGVSASCSSELFVDNSSVTITVTGNTVGTGHVYVYVYDGADYDSNDLSGKSFTVTVTVTTASGGTNEKTTTVSSTEATTKAATVTTTTEETTVDPEIELLTVTSDDGSFLVVKDLSSYEVPEGFETEETVYNTVSVQTFVCDDIVIYVLEDEDGGIDYYTLDDGEFSLLKYETNSGRFCIFLDMPDNLEIPTGYVLTETVIHGFTVEALVFDESTLEESETTLSNDIDESTGGESDEDTDGADSAQTEMKAVYTVAASGVSEENGETEDAEGETGDVSSEEGTSGEVVSVDDMTDSTDGHYYVYCMLNGEKVLCDYDSNDNILLRCAAIFKVQLEEDIAAEVVEDIVDIEEDDIDINKILLIDVIIACAVIVVLVIVLIIVIVSKRRKKDNPDEIDDIIFEEEDLFEDELDEDIPAPKSFYEEAQSAAFDKQQDIKPQENSDNEDSASGQGEIKFGENLNENSEEILREVSEETLQAQADLPVQDAGADNEKEELFEEDDTPEKETSEDEESKEETVYKEETEYTDFALDIESFFEKEIGSELFGENAKDSETISEEEALAEIQRAVDSIGSKKTEAEAAAFSGNMEVEDLADILGDEFEDLLGQ